MTSINHELQLANDFVQYTGRNIFLTGKAGTGKTTFLHNLEKDAAKRMIITAPTGVAAINAGGVTLHSFFQLPFGPYVPGSEAYERNQQRQFRFSREKKKIIKSLDLLVIDEISMVRADLLDAVDAVLRRHRRSDLPFGGVQLLMIGDLHQLAPVAKKHEWQLLERHYASIYFFSSKVLTRTELVTIELRHIYRQSDQNFINLLNRVRNNRLDQTTLNELNRRYIEGFKPNKGEGYITLTTHNNSADSINRDRLEDLDTEEACFHAEISGEFPEHIYPTPATLRLKEGAQVMFVRNDLAADKRYYNGKIGRISRISKKSDGEIRVLCPDDDLEITVKPVVWENIKYTLNQENGEIEEDIVGSFEQYPLKLAWAITIHKSQGLTFEKAIIDAEAAFAHGQVYVALSRCKTFEGLVLSSPVASCGVATDNAVLGFDEQARQNPPSEDKLLNAKKGYQQQLLLTCFDMMKLRKQLGYLVHLLLGNSRVVQVMGVADIDALEDRAVQDIFPVSENFASQLHDIFAEGNLPESDPHLQERASKASVWFQEKFSLIFGDSIPQLYIDTDNKELGKKITNVMNNLKLELAVKLAGIRSCEQGFSPSGYLRAVSAAEINFTPDKVKKQKAPEYSEADVEHPELFKMLKEWRSKKAKNLELAHFQILHQQVLIQIAMTLPNTLVELKKIRGVGKKTLEKYGEELVELVAAYRMREEGGGDCRL
jgi:hypothetical protein